MNGFRICGDFVHLLAFIILIRRIYIKQSCAGISGTTQFLLATVFTCRYLDLLTTYISIYNTLFKISFIGLAYFTSYLIFQKFIKTYDRSSDSFPTDLIVFPVLLLAVSVNYISLNGKGFDLGEICRQYINNPLEITWTFSIYLEALAIIPQLYMIIKTGDGQNVLHYIVALTVYRGLYICNWIYRYWYENEMDLISSVSGSTQTALLFITLMYIQLCKERKPKWQEIFTIEAAKIPSTEKAQLAGIAIKQSRYENIEKF